MIHTKDSKLQKKHVTEEHEIDIESKDPIVIANLFKMKTRLENDIKSGETLYMHLKTKNNFYTVHLTAVDNRWTIIKTIDEYDINVEIDTEDSISDDSDDFNDSQCPRKRARCAVLHE